MLFKEVIKSMLPGVLLQRIREVRAARIEAIFLKEWQNARKVTKNTVTCRPIERILIIPPDPGTLMSSLGDDAMVTSVIQMARARNGNVEIDVLTGRPHASDVATVHKLRPIEIWESTHFLRELAALIDQRSYDAVIALGADIMDGYHNKMASSKVIASVDLSARRKIPSAVLGFSFNAKPNKILASHYQTVSRRVRFFLRDTYSLERFRGFSDATSELSADSAFVLEPAQVENNLLDWINAKKAEGCVVIGINIHPMLFKNATLSQIDAIIDRAKSAILTCAAQRRLAWLLLPHDFRGEVGDDICLEPLFQRLRNQLGDSVRHLGGPRRAADLKGVVGQLDGVVSGRMHLAIAALGMGVPTLCCTYQDKFEGLYQHFELPDWLLISPENFAETDAFSKKLIEFVTSLPELRMTVVKNRQRVLELSMRNYNVFDQAILE